MLRKLCMALPVMLVVGLVGCGNTEETAQAPATDNNVAQANAEKPVSADQEEAANVVAEFLDACRDGDDARAERMLTEKARQQAAARGKVFAAPGNDTAEYKLSVATTLPGERMAVCCEWTDLNHEMHNGEMQTQTVECVWLLRRDTRGWRIGGVAVPVFEGESPLQLDFEDPDEMDKRLQWVRNEKLRRAKSAGSQAQRAENPNNSAIR